MATYVEIWSSGAGVWHVCPCQPHHDWGDNMVFTQKWKTRNAAIRFAREKGYIPWEEVERKWDETAYL